MKYLNFNEALKPSQFREFVLDSDRDKYADIFKSFKGEHDRNFYRLYIPITKKKSETHREIEELLFKNGYDIVDYIEGKAKYRNARNTTRIGQILQRLEKDDDKAKELSKKFIEDMDRKAGGDLMVCISRHPYDIAGADTDRNWSNCLTMAKTDTKRYKDHINLIKKELFKTDLKKLGEEIDKILEEDDTLYEIEKVDIDRYSFTHTHGHKKGNTLEEGGQEILDELEKNNIEIDRFLLVRYEDKDGFVETHNDEFNVKANDYNRIVDMILDIDKFLKSGTNVGYIKEHIKLGVLMCYLIRKDDKNINDPIANLDIKPYLNIFDTSDIFLYPDRRMYGHGTNEFKEVVKSWVNEVNKGKVGVYKLATGCYNDNLMDKTLLVEKDGNVIDDPSSNDIDNYSVDKKTLKLYSNKIKNIKTDEEAKQFAQYVLSAFGRMSGGDIVNNILSHTPDKWNKYYKKTNNRINGWLI